MKNSTRTSLLLFLVTISLFSVGFQLESNPISEIQTVTDEGLALKETIDAWLIIGGTRADLDKIEWIKWTCNKTYEQLKTCGYTDEEIRYLFPGTDYIYCPYADSLSRKVDIEYSIETWAPGQVSAGETLGIYMMDHGNIDNMPIPPFSSRLYASELDTFLEHFAAASGTNRVIIIYEACHSGSFIDELSQYDRIICTSTSITLAAYGLPPYFSEAFWGAVVNCKTIGEAFIEGWDYVDAMGYGDSQNPRIDDDHDGIGHPVNMYGSLPHGGDGTDALGTIIRKTPCIYSIYIEEYKLPFWVDQQTSEIVYSVQIHNSSDLESVKLRVRPPSWGPTAPQPDNESNFLGEDFGTQWVEMSDLGGGNYTSTILMDNFQQGGSGEYKINIVVKSVEGVLVHETGSFWVSPTGIPPTDTTNPTIMIKAPNANTQVSGTVVVTAEGNDEQALDRIEIFIDGELMNTTYMPDHYPYPDATYTWDTTVPIAGGAGVNETHIILAKAYDKAGNAASHTISVNINPISGFTYIFVIIGCFLVITVANLVNVKKEIPRLL